MNGINKVILIGNVGNDPEIRYANNGNAIANISIATSDSWKDKNTGEKQTRTEWHRVVFFGRIAEVVNDYVRKGSKLYVEGRLQTRKWTDKNNQDRYSTDVIVDVGGSMQMLDSSGNRPNQENNDSANTSPPPLRQNQPTSDATKEQPSVNNDFNDDDIPF